jgi:hypothetical protein
LSDVFPTWNGLQQADALSPLVFNFAVEYVIRTVQVNQDGLKIKGTHHLFVYAGDVNILGGSVRTIKKNAEARIVASKEIGLEVNAEKKTMVMFRDQKAGRSHNIKTDNSSFERVGEFRYLGTTLMGQNPVQEKKRAFEVRKFLLPFGPESCLPFRYQKI